MPFYNPSYIYTSLVLSSARAVFLLPHSTKPLLAFCLRGFLRLCRACACFTVLRRKLALAEAWNKMKAVHGHAQQNDGFAKTVVDMDKRLHGKASMGRQHRRLAMKVCQICGKTAGFSSGELTEAPPSEI